MRLINLALPACLFCLGLWLGRTMSSRAHEARRRESSIQSQMSELLTYKVLLGELRLGGTPKATELLEFSIDCGVSALWHRLDGAEVRTREKAIDLLKTLKVYREQWPRTPRGDLLASAHLPASDVEVEAEEAGKILAGVSQ